METKNLPPFETTIKWLKESMKLRTINSNFINDGDCWSELGIKKDLVPKEFLLEIKQALIDSGDGYYCYLYLLHVNKDDKEVRQDLIDSVDGHACWHYLYYINVDDKEIRQTLINSEDGDACYRYLRNIDKGDVEIRQALIDSEDGGACYRYLRSINKDDKGVIQIAKANGYLLSS